MRRRLSRSVANTMSPDSIVPGANEVVMTAMSNGAGLVEGSGGCDTVSHDGSGGTTVTLGPLNATVAERDGGAGPSPSAAKLSAAGSAWIKRSDGAALEVTGRS